MRSGAVVERFPNSALVSLDTGGSGDVSPEVEEIWCLCGLWHQWRLAAMGRQVGHRDTKARSAGKVLPHPCFFVSVASKGLTSTISLLFATLAGRRVNVADKGLRAMVSSDRQTVARLYKNGGGRLERRAPIQTRSKASIEAPLEARGKWARIRFSIHGEG